MPGVFSDPSFYFALIVLFALTHQKRFFRPIDPKCHYQDTVFVGILLIGTLLFFWHIFTPISDYLGGCISFYIYPVLLFCILIVQVSTNLRRTLFNLKLLADNLNNTEKATNFYSVAPALTSLLIWIVVLTLPFGFTYEAWRLSKYWDDYQAVVTLAEESDWTLESLPPEYAHLSYRGHLFIGIGDPLYGHLYFLNDDNFELINMTMYCLEPDCVNILEETNWDVICVAFHAPHWYRCLTTR